MIKPTGTIICQRCGSIQCGKLDLVCDNCNMPNWDAEELKYGLGRFSIEEPQTIAEPGGVRANMNKWEKACREWLKSCSCADKENPEECKECVDAFLSHLKSLHTGKE